jgi:hypothetical protein
VRGRGVPLDQDPVSIRVAIERAAYRLGVVRTGLLDRLDSTVLHLGAVEGSASRVMRIRDGDDSARLSAAIHQSDSMLCLIHSSLSIEVMAMHRARRGQARRVRRAQRAVHLMSGGLLLAFVYLTPDQGSVVTEVMRWLVFPVLAATGIAMWQWPRLRRLRHRRATA